MDDSLMNDDELDEFLDNINASTLDDDSDPSNLPDAIIDSDDEERSSLLIDGMEYVETQSLACTIRSGKSKKSSIIWKVGIELKRVNDGVKFWQCTVCNKTKKKPTLYKTTATTAAFRHLKREHGIIECNKRFIRAKGPSPNSETLPPSAKGTDSPVVHDFNQLASKRLIDEFRLLFLQWMICCHLALAMVENKFFRSLIRFINHTILEYLPESSNTIRKWVTNEYERQKKIKKEMILKARSRITLSFDTWTSPFNRKHVISIIAHFVNKNWERQHLQLSMSRLYGGHSGENVAAHIVPILRDWGIDNRIGFFITDNEASNGTTIDNILAAVEPTYKKADRPKRWIRCLPHTLNLIAQAFLHGDDPESFAADVGLAEFRNNVEELQELWKSRGFIGKLTNIIRHIRRSPKQREEFEKIRVDESGDIEWLAVEDIEDERQLELIANNKTRWNSTLLMLQRADKCRTRLQIFCSNWRPGAGRDNENYDLREDILSPEEWEGVTEVIQVLKPLLHYTKKAERRTTGLQDWVPIVDKLISHFYDASQRFKAMANDGAVYEWLHICCEKAWDKLNEYYKLADKSPAYYTAMVMDPSLKYEWFNQKWDKAPKRNWISGVKSTVNNHWKQYQKTLANLPRQQQESLQSESRHNEDDSGDDSGDDSDDYKRIKYVSAGNQANIFTQYCGEDAVEDFKLSDWKNIERKRPQLVQFALDHALPISISDCERSFSSAKFTLNPLRACMKSDLFEALETLRAWYSQMHQDSERKKEEIELREELEVISEAFKAHGIEE
jgi:hypothetical protein